MRPALRVLLALALAAACREAKQPDPTPDPATKRDPVPAVDPATRPASLASAKSFRFQDAAEEAPAKSATPLSLTASDGTGLRLVKLAANAVVEDPLAFTELYLTFENPEPRTLEGQFRITLPQGASISRFAMRIDGRWQEGEVVEKQAARRAYEDFLHRRQDPALLEQAAGNEFSARVFPIPANGRKELVVSYSHELVRADEPYRLPLRGLPEIAELDVRALVARSAGTVAASSLGGSKSTHEVVEASRRGWVPDRDFEVAAPRDASRAGLRHGNLVVARVVPPIATEPEEIRSLLVLVDTSASRALGFARQVAQLEQLLKGLRDGAGPDVPLAIACFDQDVELVFEGTTGKLDAGVLAKIRDRRALGASDLEGALRWAAKQAGRRFERVLVVTDGVATAGETGGDKLVEAAKALSAAGVLRLDALAVGGIREDATLARIVTAGLEKDGTVVDGDLAMQAVARRLTSRTRSNVKLEVPGAAWSWPAKLDGAQPGDAVLVYAELPGTTPFSVKVEGQPFEAGTLASAERPLLERAWVKARIARLEEQRDRLGSTDPDLREALKKQIIEVSTKHRVLSPYTALLVLETEQDYRRFGIDRRALSDILTVGPSGVTVLARSVGAAPPTVAQAPKDADRDAPAKKEEARPSHSQARLLRDLVDDEATAAGATPPRPDATDSRTLLTGERSAAVRDVESEEAPSEERGLRALAGGARGGGSAPPAAMAPPPAPAPRAAAEPPPPPVRAMESERRRRSERTSSDDADDRPKVDPYTGKFKDVMDLVRAGAKAKALERARAWREEAAGDVLALVALGEAFEANGDVAQAARAYGSLIDLFPSRADLRRFAGARLERLKNGAGVALAIDTFRKAVEQRPDHPSSHRLLAFALLRAGRAAEALDAIAEGLNRGYPDGRFAGADRILEEDFGLIAAAVLRAEPKRRDEILARLESAGASLEDGPSVRFVLNWETDANDVDFHIHDGRGGHAYYSARELPSGGELYADVTTGYGPECFTIRGGAQSRAYPYRLQAHYYSRGPMGYGMGKLQIVEHDGRGGFAFEDRPFIVMQDQAFVELGKVQKALAIR